MASGDLRQPRLAVLPVPQDEMDEVIERFEHEFDHLESTENYLEGIKDHLTLVEHEVDYLRMFLAPLIAIVTLVVPIVLAASVVYFASSVDMSDTMKIMYYAFLFLMGALAVLCGLPTYINSLRDNIHIFSRNCSCRCPHECHKHFGFVSDLRDPGCILAKSVPSTYMTTIRNAFMSFILMISRFLGLPMYFCDLCKSRTSASRACHCYHGTYLINSMNMTITPDDSDDGGSLIVQDSEYVSESEQQQESSTSVFDGIPDLPEFAEESKSDNSKTCQSEEDGHLASDEDNQQTSDEDEKFASLDDAHSLSVEDKKSAQVESEQPVENESEQSIFVVPEQATFNESEKPTLDEDESVMNQRTPSVFYVPDLPVWEEQVQSNASSQQQLAGPNLSFCLLMDLNKKGQDHGLGSGKEGYPSDGNAL